MLSKIKEHINSQKIFLWMVWYLVTIATISLTFNAYTALNIYKFKITPAHSIWTYYSITPEKEVFSIWDALYFTSHRYSTISTPITMYETMYCDTESNYLFTSVDTFNFKKWEVENKKWRFWYKDNYIVDSYEQDCFVRSCQYIEYKWYTKYQCFDSFPLFDLWIKK